MKQVNSYSIKMGVTTPKNEVIEPPLQAESAITQGNVAEFIPHSADMVLLDRIIDYDAYGLTAGLMVRDDGLLGDAYHVPAWVGIEYMAQTIAAYSGIMAIQTRQAIRLGFLLGTRRYCSNVAAFRVGSVLTIKVNKQYQDDNLGVFACQIQGEGVEARANLNVYLPPSTKLSNSE